MLAISDVIAVMFGSLSLGFLGGNDVSAFFWSVALVPIWLLLAKILGLYDRDRHSLRHLTVDELPLLVAWSLLATTGVALFLRFAASTQLSITDGARLMFVAFLSSVVLRSLSRRLWRGITPTERTVIIGTGQFAATTRTKMGLLPDVHADVVALFPELDIHADDEEDDWWRSVDRILITKPVDELHMREIFATGLRQRVKVGFLSPGC